MKFTTVISTPIGNLGIRLDNQKIVRLEFISAACKLIKSNDPLILEMVSQIKHYFNDPEFRFDLPIELIGTELQQKVWKELRKIRSGSVVTYKDLAIKLNTHPRVIGNACRANPIPLIIPCHRVVAINGLGGFCGKTSGAMFSIKQKLLHHEGVLPA